MRTYRYNQLPGF